MSADVRSRLWSPQTPPLVELRRVSKHFVKPLDLPARIANLLGAGLHDEVVHAVDRVDLGHRRARGRRTGRRVGLRQVDARPPRRRPAAADRGRALLARRAAVGSPPARRRAQQQLKMQMIFQDPYASLNPRMRVVDIVGEAPVAHGSDRAAAAGRIRRAAAQSRRPRPDADAALSAPVLGRSARAHRHRARARGQAGIPRLRRIGRGAGRVDPGAGAEPVHGFAGGAQSDVSLHQPRSGRRASTSAIAS